MSQNVKINGKTYNGITKVNLPLADGTGTATFEEPSEGGETSTALYPLAWGHFNGVSKQKEVSNGNHISITNLTSSNDVFTLNVPYCINLAIDKRSFAASDIWLPTILAGQTVKFEIKNVSVTGTGGYAVGFTIPNGNVDFETKPLGVDGSGINGTVGLSKTYTPNSDFILSSCYIAFTQTISAIEFDLEITVNGTRWI